MKKKEEVNDCIVRKTNWRRMKKIRKNRFREEEYLGLVVGVGREFAFLFSFGRKRRKVKILHRRRHGGGGRWKVNGVVVHGGRFLSVEMK